MLLLPKVLCKNLNFSSLYISVAVLAKQVLNLSINESSVTKKGINVFHVLP